MEIQDLIPEHVLSRSDPHRSGAGKPNMWSTADEPNLDSDSIRELGGTRAGHR